MQPFTKAFIQECASGNRAAQKAFFEQLYAPMFRVCLRYVSSVEDAEDCTMKGFQKAFQHMSQFRYEGENSVLYWVRRIVVNECLMHLRKKKNLVLHTEEAVTEVALPAEVLQKMDAEELNGLVMSLPAGYRTVFNLFAVDGYTHKEIAEMLGINENTSKSQFSKAKSRLKTLLEQQPSFIYGKSGQ